MINDIFLKNKTGYYNRATAKRLHSARDEVSLGVKSFTYRAILRFLHTNLAPFSRNQISCDSLKAIA